jgi:hypothetical protein
VTLPALSMIVFGLLQFSGGDPLDRLRLNPRMQPVIQQLTELWGPGVVGESGSPPCH